MTVTKVKRGLTLSTAIVEQYFYSVRDRHVIEESVVVELLFHLVTKKIIIIDNYICISAFYCDKEKFSFDLKTTL